MCLAFLDAEEVRGSNPLAPTENPQVRALTPSARNPKRRLFGTSWAHQISHQPEGLEWMRSGSASAHELIHMTLSLMSRT
jgi:hypothetical protein